MEQNSSAICLVDLYFSINAIYVVTPVYVILFGKSVFVIWSICCAPVLPKNKKLLVISLSVCDVVSGLSQILTAAAHVLSPKFIIAEIVIATLYVGEWFYCSTVYVVHLAAISIESYIYIAHSFYYIKTMKKTMYLHYYILYMGAWVVHHFHSVDCVQYYTISKTLYYNASSISLLLYNCVYLHSKLCYRANFKFQNSLFSL